MTMHDFYSILILCGYYLACAVLVFLTSKTRLKEEIKRKIMHFVSVFSVFLYVFIFDSMLVSSFSAYGFAFLGFGMAWIMEHIPFFASFLNERAKGEMKWTVALVNMMIGTSLLVSYYLKAKWVPLFVILTWGLGDAVASLIGRKFGKRHYLNSLFDKKKTLSGSLSCFLISMLISFLILLIFQVTPWYSALFYALITGFLVSFTEAISREGTDTVSVPLILLLISFFIILT